MGFLIGFLEKVDIRAPDSMIHAPYTWQYSLPCTLLQAFSIQRCLLWPQASWTFFPHCPFGSPDDQSHLMSSVLYHLRLCPRKHSVIKATAATSFISHYHGLDNSFCCFFIPALLIQWLKKLSQPRLILPPSRKGHRKHTGYSERYALWTFNELVTVYGMWSLYTCSFRSQWLTWINFRWCDPLKLTWNVYHRTRVNTNTRKAFRFIFRQADIHTTQNVSILNRYGCFHPTQRLLGCHGTGTSPPYLTTLARPSMAVPLILQNTRNTVVSADSAARLSSSSFIIKVLAPYGYVVALT